MKSIRKTKTVEYIVYQTDDGREFESQDAAQKHEDTLNGKRKTCATCGGKGETNIRTHKTYQAGYGESEFERGDTCRDCGGKGFMELVWK